MDAMLKNLTNFMRRILLTHLFAPLTAGLSLFLALAFARTDMWDAAIINYTIKIASWGGLRRLTADADLDSGFVFGRTQGFLTQIFRLRFLLIDRFVLGIAMLAISCLLYHISKVRFHMSARWSAFGVLLFLTFPSWHILASSTQTYYFVSLALTMFGVHRIYLGKGRTALLGLLLLLMSFDMNSMILFAPALAIIYEATQNDTTSVLKRLSRPFGIALLGIVYWAVSRSLSQPSGLYAGYNQMVDPFSLDGWRVLKTGFTAYSTFAILPLLGLAILACLVILFGSTHQRNQIPPSGHVLPLIFLIPLYFAAVLPYVLVQKSTFVDDFDWDGRHAIPLSIPISLIVMLATHLIFQQLGLHGRWRILWKITAVALLVVPQSFVLMHGLTMKLGRQEFEEKLITELKKEQVKPGIVEIVGLPVFIPDFRVYEANYLMYQAFGKADWWTRIGQAEDPNFVVPDWIQRVDYQKIYIYQPPQTACRTVIQVSLLNYGGFWEGVKSMLHLANKSKVDITSVKSACPS
jgi:TM2 domain-containing membrane protein YozV